MGIRVKSVQELGERSPGNVETIYPVGKIVLDINELRERDVVRAEGQADEAFSSMVVKKVDTIKKCVTFFRCYLHSDDSRYTGGVIVYIGNEEFTVPLAANGMNYILLERPPQAK